MITFDKNADCCGCYACYNMCPTGCISMKEDQEGFYYPDVDITKCSNCNACVNTCPIINIKSTFTNNKNEKLSFAAHSNSKAVLKASSSGGIFPILSMKILNEGGVVYGAGFDKSFSVIHMPIEDSSTISIIQGSKYVQSKIELSYKDVKKRLESGQRILFSGTPCQVAGLKGYLHKNYDNLITIDVVCHGVPSDMLWKKYLKEKSHGIIRNVSFRDKNTGWKDYSLTIISDINYSVIHNYSSYMRAFVFGLSLRPSCYKCRFKGDNHCSEITLADFWGIEKVLPDLNNVNGVSWIIVNNEIGKTIIDSIEKGTIDISPVDTNLAKQNNPSYSIAPPLPKNRQVFFDRICNENFDKVVNDDLCRISTTSRIKYVVRRVIEKIVNIRISNNK